MAKLSPKKVLAWTAETKSGKPNPETFKSKAAARDRYCSDNIIRVWVSRAK